MSIFGRLISEIIIFLCIINLSNTRKSPLNPLTAAGLYCGRLRWDSLSAFGASLRPTLLAIGAIAPLKASLWSGKNNQYHPFSAGDNNTYIKNKNYLQDHSFKSAHSVFYSLSNTLFL